ncbi:hypothetical protein GTV15_19005 [Streptomyces sp. SID7803]|nr:hypothetical protein [Streptomyces sp. SID7803]
MADQASVWAQEYDVRGVLVNAEVYVDAGQIVATCSTCPTRAGAHRLSAATSCCSAAICASGAPVSVLVTAPDNGFETSGQPAELAKRYDGPFPVAIKPLDRESSIGVRVVGGSVQALTEAIATLQPGNRLLVEERVQAASTTSTPWSARAVPSSRCSPRRAPTRTRPSTSWS